MRKGFLRYEEIRKYFLIYEEAVRRIGLCKCSILNFLIYEENFFFFFFISVPKVEFAAYVQDDPRFGHEYDGYGYGGTPPPDYASANPVGNDEVKQINKYFCISYL
jgi:hypothetical protein